MNCPVSRVLALAVFALTAPALSGQCYVESAADVQSNVAGIAALDGDLLVAASGDHSVSFPVDILRFTTYQQQVRDRRIPSRGIPGFGKAVDVDSGRVAISYGDHTSGTPEGVEIWRNQGGSWSLEEIVSPVDLFPGDGFGEALDLEGDRLVVSAPFQNASTGSVYVFQRSTNGWAFEARLTPPDGAALDHFGTAVALSGPWILVGSPQHGQDGPFAGAAYFYRDNGQDWELVDKKTSGDGPSSFFGEALDLEADRAVVGQPGASGSEGGAVTYFLVNDVWNEFQRLRPPNSIPGQRFGASVALSGTRLAVGKAIDGGGESTYTYRQRQFSWQEQFKALSFEGDARVRIALAEGRLVQEGMVYPLGDFSLDISPRILSTGSQAQIDFCRSGGLLLAVADDRGHLTTVLPVFLPADPDGAGSYTFPVTATGLAGSELNLVGLSLLLPQELLLSNPVRLTFP